MDQNKDGTTRPRLVIPQSSRFRGGTQFAPRKARTLLRMASKTVLNLIALVLSSSLCFAQEADQNWLSLSRLSISVSSAYHFRPWDKYNEAMSIARDAINYSPDYRDPQGFVEKIRGDLDVDAFLNYRIIEGLSFSLKGTLTRTGATTSLVYKNAFVDDDITAPTYGIDNTLRLNTKEYGLGLRYSLSLAEGVVLTIGGTIQRAEGSMDFGYNYTYRSPIYGSRFLSYSAELKDIATSRKASIELSVEVMDHLSVTSSVQFRSLEFLNLQGQGTYRNTYVYPNNESFEYSYDLDAVLSEADGYFGVKVDDGTGGVYINDYLHQLWARSAIQPWRRTIKPTPLDLSSFGASIGIQWSF